MIDDFIDFVIDFAYELYDVCHGLFWLILHLVHMLAMPIAAISLFYIVFFS